MGEDIRATDGLEVEANPSAVRLASESATAQESAAHSATRSDLVADSILTDTTTPEGSDESLTQEFIDGVMAKLRRKQAPLMREMQRFLIEVHGEAEYRRLCGLSPDHPLD
jgi:hypothetical protein